MGKFSSQLFSSVLLSPIRKKNNKTKKKDTLPHIGHGLVKKKLIFIKYLLLIKQQWCNIFD